MNEYYVGTDRFSKADRRNAMISANALVKDKPRKYPITVDRWIMDSGAFSQITQYGDFVMSPEEYIRLACHFQWCGDLQCIVTQDYMCEPDVLQSLKDIGKRASVRIHQKKTVERFIELRKLARKYKLRVPVMPVLQGWEVEDYIDHWRMYQNYFRFEYLIPCPGFAGQGGGTPSDPYFPWVGIGSTCKRNKNPDVVSEILDAIEEEVSKEFKWRYQEDNVWSKMRWHLFGYKKTGLKNSSIRDRIHSADSFAYDFEDKMKGGLRTSESRVESSVRFHDNIIDMPVQETLMFDTK